MTKRRTRPAAKPRRIAALRKSASPFKRSEKTERTAAVGGARLLWLLVPLIAIVLLISKHGGGSPQPPSQPAAPGSHSSVASAHPLASAAQPAVLSARPLLMPPRGGLDGVSLPGTGPGNRPLPPLRLLRLQGMPSATQHSELSALAAWVQAHEQAGTAVRLLIAGRVPRLTAAMSPAGLAQAPVARPASLRSAGDWMKAPIPASAHAPIRLVLSVGPPCHPCSRSLESKAVVWCNSTTERLFRPPRLPTRAGHMRSPRRSRCRSSLTLDSPSAKRLTSQRHRNRRMELLGKPDTQGPAVANARNPATLEKTWRMPGYSPARASRRRTSSRALPLALLSTSNLYQTRGSHEALIRAA